MIYNRLIVILFKNTNINQKEVKKMSVPEYTKRAIANYNNKFDRITVNLPKGTKERIKELTGQSGNGFISALVLDELERIENENKNK